MLLGAVHIISISLILGNVDSFVLLTANVEDIKQIAKKFLSESLSEQISEFISKAKVHDNLSEENERNAQDLRNSRELGDTADAYKYGKHQKPDDRYNYNEKQRKDFEDLKERANRYAQKDPNAYDKRMIYSNIIEDEHVVNSPYANREKSNDIGGNKPSRFQIKQKMDRTTPDNEDQPSRYYKKLSTPGPERHEFDQYDHFPKSDMVATSGHVVLPRVRRV